MSDYSDIRDATDCPDRPIPAGWTTERDSKIWNVGFVYRWSDVYEAWMDCQATLTVKPLEMIEAAFERRMGHPMWLEYAVFFHANL